MSLTVGGTTWVYKAVSDSKEMTPLCPYGWDPAGEDPAKGLGAVPAAFLCQWNRCTASRSDSRVCLRGGWEEIVTQSSVGGIRSNVFVRLCACVHTSEWVNEGGESPSYSCMRV